MLDEDAGLLIITSQTRWRDANPDIIEFSQVLGCDMDIDEHRTEIYRETKDGERKSNILATIPGGSTISAPRTMIQYVATEYGIAELSGKSLRERAEAMAAIAHPDFREELLKYAYENFK